MGRPDGNIFGSRSARKDRVQRGPCFLTESQLFSRPARPNSVNRHFMIWSLIVMQVFLSWTETPPSVSRAFWNAIGNPRIWRDTCEVQFNSTECVQSAQNSVKNVEITIKSWSFSLIPRRFQSNSLVHDQQLGKHYKGNDQEGLQQIICNFRLVVFVPTKTELNINCNATFLLSQNLDLVWTRRLTYFLQRTNELDVKSNVWFSSTRILHDLWWNQGGSWGSPLRLFVSPRRQVVFFTQGL